MKHAVDSRSLGWYVGDYNWVTTTTRVGEVVFAGKTLVPDISIGAIDATINKPRGINGITFAPSH